MLSLDTLTAEIHTLMDPDLCDAEKEVAELACLLTQMETIIKSRLQTKFPLLEEFFSKAINTAKGFQEIGVDTSDVEERIAVLQAAYTKVQQSLSKKTKKTENISKKISIKKPSNITVQKTSKRSPKIIVPKPSLELSLHTILDSAPSVIDVIPIEDHSEPLIPDVRSFSSKWIHLRNKIVKSIHKSYEYSADKIVLGYEYSTAKISLSWQWLRARSSDEILFGARTTGSFSATFFAILTGIGLAAGWNAPGLAITFLISVSVFAGAELTQIIRSIIRKHHPQEAI